MSFSRIFPRNSTQWSHDYHLTCLHSETFPAYQLFKFVLLYVNSGIFYIIERLIQGHLHPLLEHPSLTCPGQESNPGLSCGIWALQQRAIRTVFNGYQEQLHDPATIFSFYFFCSVMLFPYSNVSGGLSQHEVESIGED